MESKGKTGQSNINTTKNKKTKWIAISIFVLIVLTIWGTSMANEILARVMPDKYLLLSLKEMQKVIKTNKASNKKLNPKNKTTNIDLNLKEISGIDDEYFKEIIKGLGLSLSISNSNDENIKIDTSLNKSDISLMDLSIYSSNDQLGIKIPDLLDQYVMVNLDSFKNQYDQTQLSYYMGDIEQEDVDIFKNYVTEIRNTLTNKVAATYTPLANDYEKVFLDTARNIDIKYTGATKVSINNKKEPANTFLITIDSKNMTQFVRRITEATFNNEDMRKNIETILKSSNYYYTINEWEKLIYESIDELTFSDIEIRCIIDNKKRILNTELITNIGIYGEKAKINANYSLSGDKNILDQLEANIILQSDYDKLHFSLGKHKTYLNTKTNTENNIIITAKENSNQLFKVSCNIIQDLQIKPDNYTLAADKIVLKIENPIKNLNLLGSARIEIQNLKAEKVNLSDEQKLDLFSLDENQMLDIIDRIGDQFYQIGNMINNSY